MTRHHHSRLAVVAPVAAGSAVLVGMLWMLPGQREVQTAAHRAQTVTALVPAAAAADAAPETLTPTAPALPALDAAVRHDDARALATLTRELAAAGASVTTLQVARDLDAVGRPRVALDYLALRDDGASPATWRLRADLLRKQSRATEATALLTAASKRNAGIAAADIVAVGYALDRADLIVAAAASGAIPPPDATLSLDLARRAEKAHRYDLIAALDRATHADWRAADPWLAIRVAQQAGDTQAALRGADRLPPDQRVAMREAILTRAGDRAALRTMLLAQAAPPEDVAERLLTAGFRDDAVALLKRASAGQPAGARPSKRLLTLLGPRPAPADRAWLREQAARDDGWLRAYVDSEAPATALAFVIRHPQATRTDLLLMRLSLADAAGDGAAGQGALAALLDGRRLDAEQVRAISAALPRRTDPKLAATLARRRIDLGIAAPRDRVDVAWAAFDRGDTATAIAVLRDQIAEHDDDLPALRLMAEAQGKANGAAAARPWWERALAQTPPDSRARAEILDRLGRRRDALKIVAALRSDAPSDRALAAMHARLLVADGQPARARAVLAP
jgi:hypothetical protein